MDDWEGGETCWLLVHLLAGRQLCELQEATGFLRQALLVFSLPASILGPLCWKLLCGDDESIVQ